MQVKMIVICVMIIFFIRDKIIISVPPVSAPGQAHGFMPEDTCRPPTGVCQANQEPDQREMKLTVSQVSGIGVPVSRQADRAQREEADLKASSPLLHNRVEVRVVVRHRSFGVEHTEVEVFLGEICFLGEVVKMVENGINMHIFED